MTTHIHNRQERRQLTAVWRNGGLSASYDSLVVGSSAVLRLNFCAINPPLRQTAKRCGQYYQTTADKRPQNDLTITQPLEQFFSGADIPIFP